MPEPLAPTPSPPGGLSAKDIFNAADHVTQELIKAILEEEREVQHLKTRPGIHVKILDILKRTVQ
jgi:hypothetical protein